MKKQAARLGRKRCECNSIVLCDDIEPEKVEAYEEKKQTLQEEIESMEQTLEELKTCRRDTPKHVMLSDLPPEDQFKKTGNEEQVFYRYNQAHRLSLRDSHGEYRASNYAASRRGPKSATQSVCNRSRYTT